MTSGDIKKDFEFKLFNDAQRKQRQEIAAKGLEMALLIYNSTPTSAEQTTAIRKIEEGCFWANAAIARHSE